MSKTNHPHTTIYNSNPKSLMFQLQQTAITNFPFHNYKKQIHIAAAIHITVKKVTIKILPLHKIFVNVMFGKYIYNIKHRK
jgi:hypothetical protein